MQARIHTAGAACARSTYLRLGGGQRRLCASRAPEPQSGPNGGSASSAGGAAGAKASGGGRGAPARPSVLDTLSQWVWRGALLAAGAGVAGAGAMYVTDPSGTREMVRAAREDVDGKIRYFTEPSREELLPDAVPPFPGAEPLRTLVIELDTLVHSSYNRQFGWRVAKRPGADAFLAYMSTFYEIVVFTSALNTYADPILNRLDPNKYHIAYRLYRAETKYEGGVHRKDVSHLNRDLARVVVIDDTAAHCSYQPENAIVLSKWEDDSNDTALFDLIPFLEGLAQEDVPDVRADLASLRGRPLQDGLADYKAQASSRVARGARGRGGLFGAGAAPAAPVASAKGDEPPEEGGDAPQGQPAGKGSLWGQVTGSGSVFRPTGTPQES